MKKMMQYKKIVGVTILSLFTVGCIPFINKEKEIAIDKVYVQKQCPTFEHGFEIVGRKYTTNESPTTSVVLKLDDLTIALASNTKARETFNKSVVESNKEVFVKDTTASENAERTVKKIFVDRKCTKYNYSPEFNVRKLTSEFKPLENTTYVVVTLDNLTFEIEKHKKLKNIFNESVEKLN